MISFDNNWEQTYSDSNAKHINKYPYGQLATYFFRNLKNIKTSSPSLKILEVGCGVGNNLPLILNEGLTAYGVDGSPSAIEYAKNKFKDDSNCHLEVMDLASLNYEDNYFDMVIDRQSIYANKSEFILKIFHEVKRVLKPGGIFISFLYHTSDYHHIKAMNDSNYARKIEERTFTDFTGGTFKGNGIVHFFTLEELVTLCKDVNLNILSLNENIIEQKLPFNENKLAEYILVAQCP